MRNFTRLLGTLLLAGAVGLSAGTTVPAPRLTPVTVQLGWTHPAEFAGLYAADQQGFYATEGLAGVAQFGVAGTDELILARSQGKPLRAIATTYRHSPVVFMSLADKGLTRPQQFAGKIIRAPSNVAPSLRANERAEFTVRVAGSGQSEGSP